MRASAWQLVVGVSTNDKGIVCCLLMLCGSEALEDVSRLWYAEGVDWNVSAGSRQTRTSTRSGRSTTQVHDTVVVFPFDDCADLAGVSEVATSCGTWV